MIHSFTDVLLLVYDEEVNKFSSYDSIIHQGYTSARWAKVAILAVPPHHAIFRHARLALSVVERFQQNQDLKYCRS